MRWFRSRQWKPDDESVRALRDSEEALDETRGRWRRVVEIERITKVTSTSTQKALTDNHLGETFRKAFQEGGGR